MTTGFISHYHHGSCSVHGHHELIGRTHFANIEVKVRTNKRPRGHEADGVLGKTKCYVTVSVSRILNSFATHSVATSFSKVYSFRHHLKSWNDAKILAIHDVSQSSNIALTTCFGLALYGGDNRYGTVIGIIRESETTLLPVVIYDREPISATLLRGPSFLCLCASGVIILERDGVKHTLSGFDFARPSNEMTSICNTEDESFALLCSPSDGDDSCFALQISSLHWKGSTHVLFTVEDKFDDCPALRAASLSRRQSFFSTSDGVIHAIDMVSRTITWRTKMHTDVLKNLHCAMVHNDLLILSILNEAEDLYAVHVATRVESSCIVSDIRKLFSTQCCQGKETKHIHSYIPWKNSLLKVNCEKGTCCDEEQSFENHGSSIGSGNPSLFQIESYLGRRLERGLDNFLEGKERIDDKLKMMENVRALLAEELNYPSMKSFALIFERKVTCFASIPDRSCQTVQEDQQMAEKSTSAQDLDDSNALTYDNDNDGIDTFKLIHSCCQFDRLRSSVTIETQLAVNDLTCDGDEEGTKQEVSAKLRLHSNDRIPAVWSCNEVCLGGEKANCHSLWATSPLEVFTHTSNLSNLTFMATVDLSSGRSFPVGLFTLASVMCSQENAANFTQKDSCRDFSCSRFSISALGESNDHMKVLFTEEDLERHIKFKVQEHRTRITLSTTSQSEYSTLLARLTMKAGDNIKFQATPEPSKSSLFGVDTGLTILEDEKKTMQSLSTQKNVFGYTAEEIVSVIEKQIDVDEAFGLIEEQQLWL